MGRHILGALIWLACLAGCASQLTYQAKFDRDKRNHYTQTLQAEYRNVQEHIRTLDQDFLPKLEQLCVLLYDKLPSRVDRFMVLRANFKYYHLRKCLEEYQDLIRHLQELAPDMFVYPDAAEKPLLLRFQAEQALMVDFIHHLRELRVQVHLLDSLRKETQLLRGNPEENLESVEPDLKILQKELHKLVYQQLPQKFMCVGQAILRNQGFAFTATAPTLSVEIDDEEKQLQSKVFQVKNISIASYTYDFVAAREDFQEEMEALQESLKHFQRTAAAFQQANAERGGAIASDQFAATVAIAKLKLDDISQIGQTILDMLQNKVVQADELEESFWTKTSQQEKDHFDASLAFYQQRLCQLSQRAQDSFTGQAGTPGARVQGHLMLLDKEFNQGNGQAKTGIAFLNAPWRQKVSFKTTQQEFDTVFQKIRAKIQETLKPLFETVRLGATKTGQRLSYTLEGGWIERRN